MAKQETPFERAVKAAGHPIRRAIIHALAEADGPRSPAQLSRQLEEPIGNVSYHVRVLLDRRVVELTDTQARRGALEHFYRLTSALEPELHDALRALLALEPREAAAGA